jgi:hypothetical protein
MKRTLGIGVVLTLVTAGLVFLTTRPRAPWSTTSIGGSSEQRVAPPEDERGSAEAHEEQQTASATPIVAIDHLGNIGISYSFGGPPHFAGQRFAGCLANDPLNTLTLRETVLVEGEDIQTAMRWQDYTQTAIDPSDDCTIWYVGDYVKKNAASYSSKIGAFRMPGCR